MRAWIWRKIIAVIKIWHSLKLVVVVVGGGGGVVVLNDVVFDIVISCGQQIFI